MYPQPCFGCASCSPSLSRCARPACLRSPRRRPHPRPPDVHEHFFLNAYDPSRPPALSPRRLTRRARVQPALIFPRFLHEPIITLTTTLTYPSCALTHRQCLLLYFHIFLLFLTPSAHIWCHLLVLEQMPPIHSTPTIFDTFRSSLMASVCFRHSRPFLMPPTRFQHPQLTLDPSHPFSTPPAGFQCRLPVFNTSYLVSTLPTCF